MRYQLITMYGGGSVELDRGGTVTDTDFVKYQWMIGCKLGACIVYLKRKGNFIKLEEVVTK